MADKGALWLDAKTYYTQRWGEPVGRVGVDGGFSCPNRGEDRIQPGCSFCAEVGNRPTYLGGTDSLVAQVQKGLRFQSERYGLHKFSLYFQTYTSTWAPVDTLRQTYDLALAEGPFVDLTVGTRPDCLSDPVADLLASYRNPTRDVWVELGLQSRREETLKRIRRGHNVDDFVQSAGRLRERGLPFTVHVMYGLPGEGKKEFLETVAFALEHGAAGLKFHDLLLVPGSELHTQWQAGQMSPVDPEAYLDAVASALVFLPPSVVVWRVCSDPEDRRAAPSPGEKWPKNRFLNRLKTELVKRRAP